MKKKKGKHRWAVYLRWIAIAVAAFYGWVIVSLVLLRWIDPFTTAVQTQRRIESWFQSGSYTKKYDPVPLNRISLNLQHAVIAAEDGRFYSHNGFDWKQIQTVIDDAMDDEEPRRLRGASTITQQLVKNLYLSLHGSIIRKGIEATIVPLAEIILSKQRILELYLNMIEWGPGVYGAEGGAQYHYRASAARLSRDQSARLAAVLPSPLKRKPTRMNRYTEVILGRMAQHGW